MKKLIVTSMVLLIVAVTLTGCGKRTAPDDAATAVQSAMVEGADLMVRADLEGMRSAPVYAARQQDKTPEQVEKETAFKKVTGLGEEDLVCVLFSVDLDTIDFEAEEMAAEIEKVSGVLALAVKKAVTAETLLAGMKAVVPAAAATIEIAEVEGRQILVAKSTTDEDAPPIYAAISQNGKVVLISLNTSSLLASVDRADSGKHQSTPPAIVKVCASLSPDAQMVAGFVLSGKMKQQLVSKIDEMRQDAKQAMAAGMMAPFKGLQSLAMAVVAAENMDVSLAVDLGSAESANQALGTINGMVMPMIQMAMANHISGQNGNPAEKFSTKVVGSSLAISMNLTRDDLARGQDDDE